MRMTEKQYRIRPQPSTIGGKVKVTVIEESSIYPALFGIGLSYGITSGKDFDALPRQDKERLLGVAKKLAGKGGGHDKFLRQIHVVLDVDAPAYWWPEADQYKVATVTQSESKMHTLMRQPITQDRFEAPISQATLERLESLRQAGNFHMLLNELPHGWLQRRILSCNYAVLRNIIQQRHAHKLREWEVFITAVLTGVQWPEFLAGAHWPDMVLKKEG